MTAPPASSRRSPLAEGAADSGTPSSRRITVAETSPPSGGERLMLTRQRPRQRATHYLPPGQLFASREPTDVTTILGSCVAMCLWDVELHIGGINHFLLPRHPPGTQPSGRFGDAAFKLLLDRLIEFGCKLPSMRARILGGACMIQAFRDRGNHLGGQNVEMAVKLLNDSGIEVIDQNTGGDRGRKIVFGTDDGSIRVQSI